MRSSREQILTDLRAHAAAGKAILAASAGTGLIAAAAERGGADLIVLYNSAWYRSHGLPSLSALMPYGDANGTVVRMAREIVPRLQHAPVVAGVCATDPFRAIGPFLAELRDIGVAGVQNFPTIGLIDGLFREDLEASGIRFETEIQMIALASEMGLLTCAFVCDPRAAAAMTQAGADILVPHLGVTRAGKDIEDAIDRVQEMRDAAVAIRPDVVVLFHGGPADDPAQVERILEGTEGVAGFLAGSGIERGPVERAVEAATRDFIGISIRPSLSSDSREPREELDRFTLADYLRRQGLVPEGVPVEVSDLGGGVSNAVMLYRCGDDRGVVKQARSHVRVKEEWICDVRRVLVERDAIGVLTPLLPPGALPHVRFSDDENFLFVMDAAPESARLWKGDLLAGSVDTRIPRAAGTLLAAIHQGTAGDASIRRHFSSALLFQLRIDPWYMTTATRHPRLRAQFERAVLDLLGSRRALVHGDFAPKNMLVTSNDQLMLLDFEIAHFGNPAYDVATFVNHLLLKAFAAPSHATALINAASEFLTAYRHGTDGLAVADDEVLLQLGCLMLARIDGKSPVDYIHEDPVREHVRSMAVELLEGSRASVDGFLESCVVSLREEMVEASS